MTIVCNYNDSCVACVKTGSMFVKTFEGEICCVEDLATINTGPMVVVEDIVKCPDFKATNLWMASGILIIGMLFYHLSLGIDYTVAFLSSFDRSVYRLG